MNDQQTAATDTNWTSLPGTVLEGGYEIQELLGADQNGWSFKIRVLGDASIHGIVNVFRTEGTGAEEQVSLWKSAKDFQHPNLNTPLTTGRLLDTDLIYVVFQRPDERLSDVLLKRALTGPEAGEVLLSASRALEYLNAHGFVHGYLSPDNVLGVGESIKLSTEWVRRIGSMPSLPLSDAKYTAPEATGGNVTPEADIWCLGATLIEALTQKPCEEGCLERAAELPKPFEKIVPRCLDADPLARCKPAEIPALYAAAAVVIRQPEANPVPENGRAQAPARVVAEPRRGRLTWIVAAAVLLVVLAAIWLGKSKPQAKTVRVAQVAPRSTKTSAWPTQTLSPEKNAAPSPAPPERPAAPPKTQPVKQEPHTVNGPIWRVVLYTYARVEDAQKMARSINAKYPGLGAEVFSPQGQSATYLVVAGGQMDHDQAERLRRKVRSMGLPRDSYAQNYRQ